MPSILAFSCENGIFMLRDTCTAATNWPQFLKPFAASFMFVPCGNNACKRCCSFGFFTNVVVGVVSVTFVVVPVVVPVVEVDVLFEAVVDPVDPVVDVVVPAVVVVFLP